MSGLLIRYDGKGGALRSVGDAPNGILTVVVPTDAPASYAIDGSYEIDTSRLTPGAITALREHAPGGVPAGAVLVGIGALLDACEGDMERGLLVQGVVTTILSAAENNAQAELPLMVEYLQPHVDFLAALREALLERGLVRRTPPGAES